MIPPDWVPTVIEVDSLNSLERLLTPRRYGTVPGGNYGNTNVFAHDLAYCVSSSLAAFQNSGKLMWGQTNTMHIAFDLARNRMPYYFIDGQLARAIAATAVPKDMSFGEIQWPLNALTFAYPLDFMRELTGYNVDIGFVSGAIWPHSGITKPPIEICPELIAFSVPAFQVDEPRMAVTFVDHRDFVVQNFLAASYHASHELSSPISDIDTIEYLQWKFNSGLETTMNLPVADEQVVSRKVVALFMKTLLVISALEPRYVEREAKLRDPIVKRGVHKPALWRPNFIGRAFTLPKHTPVGTHATPIYHVRRRHVVRQAIGPRDKLVHVSSLPRKADGRTDWDAVTDEQKAAFWKCHENRWIEEQWLGVKEDDANIPS